MAPQLDTQAACHELEKRGIPYLAEYFLRHVKSGNLEIVEYYLAAGMSPNTSLDGDTALFIAANAGHREIGACLIRAGADPLALVDRLKANGKSKDPWEKLSSISGVFTFISSLLIAALGWYFTNQYNLRQFEEGERQAQRELASRDYQNRLAEMQTVEKMIPHLAKDETSRQAALVAISVLASPAVATRIAEVYGGQASVSALTQIAAAGNPKESGAAVSALTTIASGKEADAGPAKTALAKVLQGREKAVVKLMIGDQPVCNGFVVEGAQGWIVTPGYCLEALKAGGKDIAVRSVDNANLKIRSTHLSPDRLVAFIDIEPHGLPELRLSSRKILPGEKVLQLAFDAMQRGSELKVNLGEVIAVTQVRFGADVLGVAKGDSITANALKVKLPSTPGSGGAPLLDTEGNVACMTFQGSQELEECLPASNIRAALDAARPRQAAR